jgi:hypothetical protein
MNPSSAVTAALTCHPATPCGAVRGIQVEVRQADDATLALHYALDGDLSRLRIPAPSPGRRADGLWQHTCFELFCATGTTPAYYELNFSPSSEWAIYGFDYYRAGMATVETHRAPWISMHQRPDGLHLDAVVDLGNLSALYDCPVLQLALSAVIEEADGRLSYWALAHPAAKPDFHHAGGFALAFPYHPLVSARRGERG